jgi:hypothetical protein
MKALTQCYKMHIHITVFKSLIIEDYLFAGPSMQQQRGVDRTKMRHLARHPELNLNPLKVVDSLTEKSFQILEYVPTHFYLSLSRSSSNKGRKAQSVVLICSKINHPRATRGPPSNANWPRF